MSARTVMLVGLLAGLATPAAGQILQGSVVSDDSGAPLIGAEILVLNWKNQPRMRGLTDTAGNFVIDVQQEGDYKLQVTHIGYAAFTSAEVWVPRRETVQIRVRLGVAAIPLDPLVVIGRMSPEEAHLAAFNQRRLDPGRVGGYFLTREEIGHRPNATPAQLLLSVPGVRLDRVNNANAFAMDRSIIRFPGGVTGNCRATVYVDGAPVSQSASSTIDDMLDNTLIGGVEVYPRASEAPVEYQRNMGCGVVLYWTRRPGGGRTMPTAMRWIFGTGVVLGLFAAVFSAVVGGGY